MMRLIGYGIWLTGFTLVVWLVIELFASSDDSLQLREEVARLTERDRVARIYVHRITGEGEGAQIHLRWIEAEPDGRPGRVRDLVVDGSELFVHCMQIVFEDSKVREGDPLRGKALNLFTKLYSERIPPKDGPRLDLPAGSDPMGPPDFFRSSQAPSEVERQLWAEFGRMAKDSEYARQQGVRTVQGKSVSRVVEEGKEYHITLSRTGQLDFGLPRTPDPLLLPQGN